MLLLKDVCLYLFADLTRKWPGQKSYLSIEPNHLQSEERENGQKEYKQNFMPVVYFTPIDLIK